MEKLKKQFSYRTTDKVLNEIKQMAKEYGLNANELIDIGVYLVSRDLRQGKTVYDLQNEMYRNE